MSRVELTASVPGRAAPSTRVRRRHSWLNPKVIDACRQFFHLPAEAPDFRLVNADAGGFAADPAHAGTAQALCVDLYDDEAAGPVLDSAEFYADCFGLLAHGGAMTVNVFGREASFVFPLMSVQRYNQCTPPDGESSV